MVNWLIKKLGGSTASYVSYMSKVNEKQVEDNWEECKLKIEELEISCNKKLAASAAGVDKIKDNWIADSHFEHKGRTYRVMGYNPKTGRNVTKIQKKKNTANLRLV
jgi:hypothetical protein